MTRLRSQRVARSIFTSLLLGVFVFALLRLAGDLGFWIMVGLVILGTGVYLGLTGK